MFFYCGLFSALLALKSLKTHTNFTKKYFWLLISVTTKDEIEPKKNEDHQLVDPSTSVIYHLRGH